VDLFLRWRGAAPEALDAAAKADPSFALAQCTRAYVAFRMGRGDVATSSAREALALADNARDERERIHLGVVEAMHRGDQIAAWERMSRIAERYPTGRGPQLHHAGNYRGGIDITRKSLEADPDEPQYQTMLGLFLEQSGFNDEGLAISSRSLAEDPTNLYHAVDHAYQARGHRSTLETFARAASLERDPMILARPPFLFWTPCP
jgi:tetratricopeptide (TPR) repeat protein